jgi:hypothetical protein
MKNFRQHIVIDVFLLHASGAHTWRDPNSVMHKLSVKGDLICCSNMLCSVSEMYVADEFDQNERIPVEIDVSLSKMECKCK